MKKVKQYAEELANDAIACAERIEQEGDKSAEKGYRVIVALLLREILTGIGTIRCYTAAMLGFCAGLLLSKVLSLFL